MIPIDVKIESLIHRSFVDFEREQKIEPLIRQFIRYDHEGFQFKFIDTIKGECNNLIRTANSRHPMGPEREGFRAFIKAEKLAALRLLKFNSAAALAEIETNLDLANQKTTAAPIRLKPIIPILYYGVFLKGKDVYILLDTNHYQFHWTLKTFIKSLRTKKENI